MTDTTTLANEIAEYIGKHGTEDTATYLLVSACQALRRPAPFDMHAHLRRQAELSARTFGPGARTDGVCDHIRKELVELQADAAAGVPTLPEWVDVIILAFDGALRTGATPEAVISAMVAKQTRNEGRTWPDWRTADRNKAIEHDRSGEANHG